MPNTACAEKIWKDVEHKNVMVVGMIDYGTCDISNIQPCCDSFLDGIRVIFKEHLMKEAMEYCRQIKKLGYKVFAQLVSVTTYTKKSMLELIELVNDVKPYAVSMVDTYGLLKPNTLLEYYEILDEYVCPEVQIGFHAHNNFQLAYANALAFVSKPNKKHDIVVDGTLFGMGKSAGNAPIELLAMSLNEDFNKNYQINAMLESVEESIMDFFEQSPWGYKMFFYLCALNKCHPSYLSYYEKKENLSISKLNDILSEIEPVPKKLLYDKKSADELYTSYMSTNCCDEADKQKLKEILKNRSILLVGPGKNIGLQSEKIEKYIKEENPYVISINYIPESIDVDSVFVTNVKRYRQLVTVMEKEKNKNVTIIATTNVECRNGKFEYHINRAPLLENNQKIKDSSFLMMIKLLDEIGIVSVTCAGFDGYSEKEDNYLNPEMEYYFVKKEASNLNQHMRESIYEYRRTMNINFLTFSLYDQVEDVNSAAF